MPPTCSDCHRSLDRDGNCRNPDCDASITFAEQLYTIEWSIDLMATSHEDAARKALEIQRDPDSIATVFDVTPYEGGRTVEVDLGPNGEE